MIELSGGQRPQSNERAARVQFEFQTKIARHGVQLPLYYIHFEITQIQDLINSVILLMQYFVDAKFAK